MLKGCAFDLGTLTLIHYSLFLSRHEQRIFYFSFGQSLVACLGMVYSEIISEALQFVNL